jgi:hypothetical protein
LELTRAGLRFEDVVRLATRLPGVRLVVGARARSLRLRGRLLARFRDNDHTLVLRVPMTVRELLRTREPAKYFLEHTYLDYPYVLVRLAAVSAPEISALLDEAHRSVSMDADERRRARRS